MTTVLVTFHSQTGNTKSMAEAVARGANDTENARAVLKAALTTTADDLRTCDGLVICSPEYFGYMAGAVKDLFDRTYEELKDDPAMYRKPYCVVVSAGNDGSGTLTNIERLCRGYRFRKVQQPLVCKGPVTEEALGRCYELGRTVAEGLLIGIF